MNVVTFRRLCIPEEWSKLLGHFRRSNRSELQ